MKGSNIAKYAVWGIGAYAGLMVLSSLVSKGEKQEPGGGGLLPIPIPGEGGNSASDILGLKNLIQYLINGLQSAKPTNLVTGGGGTGQGGAGTNKGTTPVNKPNGPNAPTQEDNQGTVVPGKVTLAEVLQRATQPSTWQQEVISAGSIVGRQVAGRFLVGSGVRVLSEIAPKLGGKVVSRFIPGVGWALLGTDLAADIARLFGADMPEWLGFSGLITPFLGYNPEEEWVAGAGARKSQAEYNPSVKLPTVIAGGKVIPSKPKNQDNTALTDEENSAWARYIPQAAPKASVLSGDVITAVKNSQEEAGIGEDAPAPSERLSIPWTNWDIGG